MLRCSGKKKSFEASQVQDHRALRKAEAGSSWPPAYGLFGAGNAFASCPAEQERQQQGVMEEHPVGAVPWQCRGLVAWPPLLPAPTGCRHSFWSLHGS